MPNWCDNEVQITGNADELRELMTKAQANNSVFLMNNLVPMPEKFSDEGWYEWRLENWGTKWDLSQEYGETQVHYEDGDTELGLIYLTAWAPNRDFWLNISKQFPSLTIDLRYVEEGMWFMGQDIIKAGDIVEQVYHNDIPDEIAIEAGAVLDDKGEIDWDESNVEFWRVFPLIKQEAING